MKGSRKRGQLTGGAGRVVMGGGHCGLSLSDDLQISVASGGILYFS